MSNPIFLNQRFFFLLNIVIIAIFFNSCKKNSYSKNEIQTINIPPNKASNLKQDTFYNIKKFVDGDTFWLDTGGCEKGVKIRLIGMNTPEDKSRFGRPEEPFGKEATKYMQQLIVGKKIRVEFDVDLYDRYNRSLAYCYIDDGIFLNLKMVEEGWAHVSTYVPNVLHEKEFISAQKEAQKAKKGMWVDLE